MDAMESIIRSGDVEIACQTFGDADDPALVLVMGATASMLWWPEEMCVALARRGFRVVRYDNRDTGRSTTAAPGAPSYAVEDMAGDLMGVMDALGIASAHVAGMSLGGMIAQIAALTWPERVRSLALIGSEPLGWTGPALPGLAPVFMEHFANFGELDWSDRDAVAAFMLEGERLCAGSGHVFDVARALSRVHGEIDRARDIASAFNHGMLTLRDDWSGRIAEIACPVLVLHGADDPILPVANGEALAGEIPGAKLVVLEGLGHELPEAYLGRIVDALAGFANAA